MIIKPSPQRADYSISYERNGDNFIIHIDEASQTLDLSGDWVILEPDEEGQPLEPTGYLLAGVVENGQITLTVRAPHAKDATESERFPDPITLNDGEKLHYPGGIKE